MVKNPLAMQETLVDPRAGEITWSMKLQPTPVFCNVGVLGSIPGLGRSAGEKNSYPLQYSGLENSMDYTVHGITKSWTRLSDLSLSLFLSSILAWRIPWTEGPGRLQSMGSQRVRYS